MQSPSRAQQAVFAPVQYYNVMYTTDIARKPRNRGWHDGTLTLHAFNGRLLLFDDKGCEIDRCWHYAVPRKHNDPPSIAHGGSPRSDPRTAWVREDVEVEMEEGRLVRFGEMYKVGQTDVSFTTEPKDGSAAESLTTARSMPSPRGTSTPGFSTPRPLHRLENGSTRSTGRRSDQSPPSASRPSSLLSNSLKRPFMSPIRRSDQPSPVTLLPRRTAAQPLRRSSLQPASESSAPQPRTTSPAVLRPPSKKQRLVVLPGKESGVCGEDDDDDDDDDDGWQTNLRSAKT